MKLRFIILFGAFAVGSASAQVLPASEATALDRAEAVFFEGLAHFRANRHERAAMSFQEAFRLTGHTDMLFNVARSREELGDKEGAVAWYKAYLRTLPADETAIIHHIRRLGGEPTFEEEVKERRDKERREALYEPRIVTAESSVVPWVLVGAGAVMTGVGAFVGLEALDDAAQARIAEVRDDAATHRDEAISKAMFANVAIGVGGIAFSAAAYLWWRDDADAAEGRVELTTTSDAAVVGYGGRF